MKEAKAELVKDKANAKVDRVMSDMRHDAAVKQADASKEANSDKRDAEYKVAIEKWMHSRLRPRTHASAKRRRNTASREIDAGLLPISRLRAT